MTIRTLIEVVGSDDGDHRRKLEAALDLLGYERKDDRDQIMWMRDLYEVLEEQGVDYRKLIAEKQEKRFAERMK
jgi:hypothetical protein